MKKSKPSAKSKNGHRWTIGLLNDTPIDPNSASIWAGVDDVASRHDVNLICFPAGALRSGRGFDAQANILYDLAGGQALDGIICWTTPLHLYCPYEEIKDFFRRYGGIPIIALSIPIEGAPTIKFDSYQGTYDLISHLIKDHHLRKIATIRGPDTHPEAKDRFRAYCDALAANDIPFDPMLVAPGDYKKLCGMSAVDLFLDARRLTPEAIVAANDLMALGAMEALLGRGIRVPGDISVVGFDDIAEARQIMPALTTVKQSFFEQARHGTEMILKMLAGVPVKEDLLLQTPVVIRQSCACLDPLVLQADASAIRSEGRTGMAAFAGQHESIRAEMACEANNWPGFADLNAALLNAFQTSMNNGSAKAFIQTFFEVLCQTLQAGMEVACWDSALSVLRRNALAFLPDGALRDKAENLFQQARVMIGETALQAAGASAIKAAQKTKVLNEISQSLISIFDLDELMDTIVRELPKLDIGLCCISIYEDPAAPCDWSRLILIYDGASRPPLEGGGIRFPSRQLAPKGMLPQDKRFSLVVEPLYFRQEQIGFALFDANPRQGVVYDTLRAQLSCALKGERLVHGIEQRSADLAKAYTDLKENQQKLMITEKMASLGRLTAGIAHEMNTPLAAVRAALKELTQLVDEYRRSVGNNEVQPEDHQAIADDMMKNLNVASRAAEKNAGFIRGIKAQTIDMAPKPHQAFPAAVIIKDTLSLLEFALRRGQCGLETDIDESVQLYGDPRSLSQILTNLITNAVEACAPDGGTISMILQKREGQAELRVRDSGCGIPEENMARIFDPLFTTKPFGQGTGLGLSILHDLVDEFKGTVRVESQPGSTTFFVVLPMERRQA